MKGVAADRRAWLGLAALLALLVVAAGWLALIAPVQADTDALSAQETAVLDRNAALARSTAALRQQQSSLPSLRAALERQVRGLPSDGGLPELTRQLTDQATAAGVGMRGVVVGALTPVTDDGTRAGATAAAASGASAPGTAPGTTGTTGTTGAAGQLYAIPVTVTTTGPAARQIAFLRAVQQDGPRRALVVSTQLSPGLAGETAGATGSTGTADATGSTPGQAGGSIAASCTMTTVLTVFAAPVSPEKQAQLERLIAGPYAI